MTQVVLVSHHFPLLQSADCGVQLHLFVHVTPVDMVLGGGGLGGRGGIATSSCDRNVSNKSSCCCLRPRPRLHGCRMRRKRGQST